jgi:RNA-directed DNA polymerase
MHFLNPELLRQSFYQLKRQSAKDVNGISWHKNQEDLENRLVNLYNRIQGGGY